MAAETHILIVEPDRDRALAIIDALKDGGWTQVTAIGETAGLARKLAEVNPDIVLINLADPSRDMLEQVS
ncbi:MAG: two-component system response regulator, partial [Pseudomonadota bacterium]